MKPDKCAQISSLPLLTIGQVGDHLQVAPRTVRRLIAAGAIIAVRVGVQLRITEADLEHYVRRQRGM
jgi:excisionase family DNA binding protein